MADGSALPRFKRAFIDQMSALAENVSYQSPGEASDMDGTDGSGLAIWFSDDAQGSWEIPVMAGGTRLYVQETWHFVVYVQALGRDTSDDQRTVDDRASNLLGSAMSLFSDPSFGITDDTIQTFAAVPAGAVQWHGGILPPGDVRAARFEFPIELSARIQIGT